MNYDHSLPAVLRQERRTNGDYISKMHDNGGGKRSMTPFNSDFSRFTTTTSTSFGGITGGSSSSPGDGVVDYVSLDADGRVYVYSDKDVMYSPLAMIRMYASEPAHQLGHHMSAPSASFKSALTVPTSPSPSSTTITGRTP
jgi:hypothetical protein